MKTGEQLKLIGLARARKKHSTALDAARAWARTLAAYGPITIEEVRAKLDEHGVSKLGNAAGAVFDGPEWMAVGWRQSTRPESHYRAIRVWSLRSMADADSREADDYDYVRDDFNFDAARADAAFGGIKGRD